MRKHRKSDGVTAVDASGPRTLYALTVESPGFDATIDVTDQVAECVGNAERRNGVAQICVAASTAAVVVMRYEPGAVADLTSTLAVIAPDDRRWHHEVETGDPNGASHLRSELLGTGVLVPFVDGQLAVSTTHRIVLVDFDRRCASRTVFVEV